MLTIEVRDHALSGAVQVLDLNGRKVAEMAADGRRRFALSLGHLAHGNYFLALATEVGTVVRRVVVAR